MLSSEELAKVRFEEGEQTEEAYLNEVTARLNSELSYIQAKNSYLSARRSILRVIGADPNQDASFEEIRLPFRLLALNEGQLLESAKASSSAFVRAQRDFDYAERKLQALSKLKNSVTPKEIETATDAVESASRALETVAASLEDQVWELISRSALLVKSVETGEQLLAVATKKWEAQQEQHKFGLISDLQLESLDLSFRQSRSQAVQKVEDYFLHYVKTEHFSGSDIEDLVESVLASM